ncbi:response regulator [Lusitaniella coriacea]|uniref:hybrid sensor histidine kinase/response regulator n=1 Tax=Lusitaniella coriacea TaxID=1983105 RepID=UPI003CF46553
MTSVPPSDSLADILIADDTPDNLRLLSVMLVEGGYKVRKAINGVRALQAVGVVAPDLILLDIAMPEMDGYEVCRTLKENSETADIPVIFLSASHEAIDKVMAFELGAADYISKPFDVQEVLVRVETHLKVRQLKKQLQAQNAQFSRELSDRVAAEAPLQTLNNDLESRLENLSAELQSVQKERDRLEAKLRASHQKEREFTGQRDRFLNILSHELRTPLNGILGHLPTILDDLCDSHEEERELLQQANDSALQLLGTIENLLEIASLKVERIALSLKPINLNACLKDAIAPFLSRIQQKQLQLIEQNLDRAIVIQADREKLKKAFQHLLDNAIKFTERGTITISTRQDSRAIVTIQDTGIGIDPTWQHKIFEPFAMVEDSRTRLHRGTGLGLTISKHLIDLMGGELSVVSAGRNLGTIVTISFPLPQ